MILAGCILGHGRYGAPSIRRLQINDMEMTASRRMASGGNRTDGSDEDSESYPAVGRGAIRPGSTLRAPWTPSPITLFDIREDYEGRRTRRRATGSSQPATDRFERGYSFREMSMLPRESMEVYVLWYVSPQDFYVGKKDDQIFYELGETIQNYYVNRRKANLTGVDHCVIARSEVDNKHYRAKVLSRPDGNSVEVYYVDYGNVEKCSDIWHIHADHCSFPPYAMRCSLENILPIGGKWPDDDEESEITDFFIEQTLKLVFGRKENEKWMVKASLNGVDVRDSLIEKKLAEPTPGFSVKEMKLMPGESMHGCAWWYVSPGEFYFGKLYNAALKRLTIDIRHFYPDKEKADKSKLKVNDYVIALCDADKQLYRGKILSFSNDGTSVLVYSVDYGNIYECSDVWTIIKKHCKLPAQAIRCSLEYIKPKGNDEWCTSTEIFEFLEEEILKVVLRRKVNGVWIVKASIDGVDVGDSLLEKELVELATDGLQLGVPIKERDISAGQSMEGFVEWYYSPQDFFFGSWDEEELKHLYADIRAFYPDREKADLSKLKVDDYVIALCEERKNLYRAKVTGISGDVVDVFFLDDGNCGTSRHVWNIVADHCVMPPFVILCSLENVQPTGDVWPDPSECTDLNFFIDPQHKLVFSRKVNETWKVKVFTNGVDLRDLVIEKGLAEATEDEDTAESAAFVSEM